MTFMNIKKILFKDFSDTIYGQLKRNYKENKVILRLR